MKPERGAKEAKNLDGSLKKTMLNPKGDEPKIQNQIYFHMCEDWAHWWDHDFGFALGCCKSKFKPQIKHWSKVTGWNHPKLCQSPMSISRSEYGVDESIRLKGVKHTRDRKIECINLQRGVDIVRELRTWLSNLGGFETGNLKGSPEEFWFMFQMEIYRRRNPC